MRRRVHKRQVVPAAILAVLLLAGIITLIVARRVKAERAAFSVDQYERLMHRIDAAIESISDTMTRDGLAADFEELLEREPYAGPDAAEKIAGAEGISRTRVPLYFTGVAWSSRVPLAFINGMTVGKGDRIGDAEIVAIGPQSVTVKYPDDSKQTLTLEPEQANQAGGQRQ